MNASREHWIEIRLEAPRDEAEQLADALTETGAHSVTLEDAAEDPVLEPAPGEVPLWPRTSAVGLFDAGADPEELLHRIQLALDLEAPPAARVQRIEARDWDRDRLEELQPMRFGERLWICPSGREVSVSDAVTIDLDPGLAFGTGAHPTTALCLEWLDRHCRPGDRVIDYGCGSGILAIAAAKLGASSVWAVDIDPQALHATLDNAAANRVADRITAVRPGELPEIAVDCLLANILARTLTSLASEFAALLVPGGRLTLSGILRDQADSIDAAIHDWFEPAGRAERDDWVRLDAIRR